MFKKLLAVALLLLTTTITPAYAQSNQIVTGLVAGTFTGGFTLNSGSPHGMIHIYTSNATIDGPVLSVNEQVAVVTSSGSWSTSFTASEVSPLTGPSRMQTAAYLGSRTAFKGNYSSVSSWIDYAQLKGSITEAPLLTTAGIPVQLYFDPNLVSVKPADSYMNYGTPKWASTCAGVPVQYNYKNGEALDQMPIHDAPQTISMFQAYLKQKRTEASGAISLLFEDDSVAASHWSNNICNYSDSSWYSAMNTFNSDMPLPLMLNGNDAADLAGNSNVLGMNVENCYSSGNGKHDYHDQYWLRVTNYLNGIISSGKTTQCFTNNIGDGAVNTDDRMYVLGSFLQTFDSNQSLLWENYSSVPSGFTVMPEISFVPMYPNGPASIANGLATRSYRQCYYQGTPIGPCESIVNYTASTTLTPPATSFAHTMILHGDGVLDGGSVTFDGPIPTSLPPETAVVETN